MIIVTTTTENNLVNSAPDTKFTRMIPRNALPAVTTALDRQAAVGLIGPRQVGKTTLALEIADRRDALYLDLESSTDRAKLDNPNLFLGQFEDRLVVLDEIHRVPQLFRDLRGLIDRGRQRGRRTGRFLILGSASIDLLRQSAESLAGRIEFVRLNPLSVAEIEDEPMPVLSLWVRGGFPDSLLAATDSDSTAFRRNFIQTYLHRDITDLAGVRLPAETIERLWQMLAHSQGSLLNASKLAGSLGVSSSTVTRYVDLLVDLLLLRRLTPVRANVGKRLTKTPKVYVRDSGLVHALLGIRDYNALAGHPVAGASWEGFVIENLLAVAPPGTRAGFYRTQAGAEIDLVLHLPGRTAPWAIEVKLGLAPKPSRGLHHARADLKPGRTFIVGAGDDRYAVAEGVEVIGLRELVGELGRDVE